MSHLPPGSLPNSTPDLSAAPSEVPDPQQTCVLGCPSKAPKNRRLRKSVAQTQLTGNKLNLGESEEPADPAERFKSSMALKRVACVPDLLMLRARPESLSCIRGVFLPTGLCAQSQASWGEVCRGRASRHLLVRGPFLRLQAPMVSARPPPRQCTWQAPIGIDLPLSVPPFCGSFSWSTWLPWPRQRLCRILSLM